MYIDLYSNYILGVGKLYHFNGDGQNLVTHGMLELRF